MNLTGNLSEILALPDFLLRKINNYLIGFETDIHHLKDYQTYWTTPFPEGEQEIYVVSGNSDSSDFHTALSINNIKDYLNSQCDAEILDSDAEILDSDAEILDSDNTESEGSQSEKSKDPFKSNIKFTCYQNLAKAIFNSKDDCELFTLIDCSYDDGDIPDEDHEFRQRVQSVKTPLELFTEVVENADNALDPVLFVREHNPLLQWLINKRGI